MAEFAVPRHSAVMERLRRRIELCRRHHGTCEGRYEAVAADRLELERQQTYSLHQRCLQAKAKRAGKHRTPAASSGVSDVRGGTTAVSGDSGTGPEGEQNRSSSALIAQLHETMKRKLGDATSPQNGDQPNGYGDPYSIPKKLRHEDGLGGNGGSNNGMLPVSPLHSLDNKPPTVDGLHHNGSHSVGLDGLNKKCLADSNLQLNGGSDVEDALQILKDLKQEPVDDLPCMLSVSGGPQNNLMPDLNLNEQEWKELIDELNRSVPDEDMKDLFDPDFGGKKDLEPSNIASQVPLAQDIHIKTEFSPSAFDQEQIGSPQVRPTSSGPSFTGPTSVPAGSASPVLGGSQTLFQSSKQPVTEKPSQPMMQASKTPQNIQRTLNSVMLPGQGTGTAKEMSSAHQLQQIAAKQKRDQLLQAQPHHQSSTLSNWQQSGPSRSPLGVTYSMEKPSSPLVYQQDFKNQKLIMPTMVNQSSPRANAGYLQQNHVGMLPQQPNTLNQTSVAVQNSMLDYGNTKPLTHYKADCGPGNTGQAPNKAAILAYIQQQQQQQQRQQAQVPHMTEGQAQMILMKRKSLIACRPMVPHGPDQNPSTTGSRVAVSVQGPGVGTQGPVVSMAGTLNNPVYLNSQQQAVVMKQHQMLLDQQKQQLLEQQKQQFLMGQRQQQLIVEQEKQRHQQEQQLQRHLTRPPPQYQDQTQNAYQQQVGQFPGSSPAITAVNSLGQSNSSSPRMFSQTQTLVQIGAGHSSVSSVPTGPNQQERSVAQYPSMQNVQRGVMYNMASGIPQMVPTHTAQVTIANGQPQMQRQSNLVQGSAVLTGYAPNPMNNANLAQQNKGTMNPALSKPQMVRLPTVMAAQNPSWQHQPLQTMNSQVQGSNGLGQFNATTGFHLQQSHLKMTNQPFSQGMPQTGLGNSRPMTGMNSAITGQMIASLATQQRTNPSGQPAPPQQVLPSLSQPVTDMTSFSQNQNPQMANRASLHCGQGYQVRTSNQELPFAYNSQSSNSGLQGLTGDAELIDSLLKNGTSEEWMNDLDELLGTH